MGLEELLAALERDAVEEAESIRSAARAEAERIVSQAKEALQSRHEARLRSLEVGLRRELEMALTAARRAARRRVLEAKWRAIGKILEAVKDKVPRVLENPQWRAVLIQDCLDSLEVLAGRPGKISATPALVEDIKAALEGRSEIEVIADAGVGTGFRIESADGALEVDGTLEKRLEREREGLAIEIGRLMAER
ncbi:MAG: hypothetical protein KatS3mg081_2934 [Gemmatimonadales bacterium]|nr:MAG: hypothetical protein KatS3mg081_2934 [Gemmatimonadales bacterium]